MKKIWGRLLLPILLAATVSGCGRTAVGSGEKESEKQSEREVAVEYMQSESLNENRMGLYNKFDIPEVKSMKLADIFGNNMVLQRNKPVRVWGVAPAGEKVTVRLKESASGKEVAAAGVYAAEDDTFLVELPAREASETAYELTAECGAVLRRYENVLFGEVVLATGQSNMQVALCETYEWDELAAAATNGLLRFYAPGILAADDNTYGYRPQLFTPKGTAAEWTLGTDATYSGIGAVSAIAYSAATEIFRLFREEGKTVPVGVLSLPVGGTGIACWLPRYAAEEDSDFKRVLSGGYLPYKTDGSTIHYIDFTALFNYKIAPVVNYNIGGTLWYQGETDAGNADMYRAALEKLITSWGEEFRFGEEGMPFVMSQIAPFNTGAYENTTTAIVAFNTVFSENAATKSTRSAVAIYDCRLEYELGDGATIHTRYKKEVGERMGKSYFNVAVKGGAADGLGSPEMVSVTPSGNKLIVKFSSVGEGLWSKDGLPVTGFAVAGADGNMIAAEAEITAPDTVELTSRRVEEPLWCTYAYSSLNMRSNLVNSENCAALPFAYTNGVLTDSRNYCQHEYLSCDVLKAWRFLPVVIENGQPVYKAGYVPLFTAENAVFSSDRDDALRGNCLRIEAESGAALSIPLDYPYDVHQFNRFTRFAFCVKGETAVGEVTVVVGDRRIVLTKETEESAGNGYTRYVFLLREVTADGAAQSDYRYPDRLSRLEISLGEGTGYIDEMELF